MSKGISLTRREIDKERMAKVKLLRYTPEPEKTVAMAAKLCYSASGVESLSSSLTPDAVSEFIENLFSLSHLSPFEHVCFTFGIEGISRAASHQLVRHRIASYSQQSQRYVNMSDFDYVIPPSILEQEDLKKTFIETMQYLQKLYTSFVAAGVKKEDARYVLPNACQTRIIVSMNARELLHFFKLRSCNRAQWEIRAISDAMIGLVKEVSPILFKRAGPACVTEACPEGEMSCGRSRREEFLGKVG